MPLSLNKTPSGEYSESHLDSFLEKNEFLVSAVILIASLLYYMSFVSYGFNEGDWGLIAIASERFLEGQVFYRDFGIIYSPGIYLYTALFFKLFGTSIHSAAVSWTILRALNCLLIYRLGINFIPRRLALLLPLILWLASGTLQKSFFTFFILLNLLIVIRLLSSESKGFYFFSGIMAGIALSFRIDLLANFVISVSLVELLKSMDSLKKGEIISQIRRSLKNLFIFSGGALIATLPFVWYLYLNGAMDDFFMQFMHGVNMARPEWFITRPLLSEIFSWTKWDFVHYAILFVPTVIYALLFIVLVSDLVAGTFSKLDKKLSIIFLLGSMVAFNQIINGPGLARLFLSSPPILIADLYLIHRFFLGCTGTSRKTARLINTISLTVVNIVFFSLIIASCFTKDMLTNSSIFVRFINTEKLSIPPRVNVHTYPSMAEETREIMNIIETTTRKGEPIFTIPHLVMYYFISGRPNGTRFDFMEQYAGSNKREAELIKELEAQKVKLIIFRTPIRYDIPRILEYINRHYRILKKVGNKTIYIRDNIKGQLISPRKKQ